ncbi:hypothetical protein NDU88_000880 [Pleurodeles waltl]|uniref:Uncharacterized protein n=1 Tax=Pleurodeles waltl TaxID=8319 RepID=A0AAV7KN44_PLEWA|nr:hypothetical protein NDU88_000880 [Pleurodeles waltl]
MGNTLRGTSTALAQIFLRKLSPRSESVTEKRTELIIEFILECLGLSCCTGSEMCQLEFWIGRGEGLGKPGKTPSSPSVTPRDRRHTVNEPQSGVISVEPVTPRSKLQSRPLRLPGPYSSLRRETGRVHRPLAVFFLAVFHIFSALTVLGSVLCRLMWFGCEGLQFPNLLVIHVGGNYLVRLGRKTLREAFLMEITRLSKKFPNAAIAIFAHGTSSQLGSEH